MTEYTAIHICYNDFSKKIDNIYLYIQFFKINYSSIFMLDKNTFFIIAYYIQVPPSF